jgi:hypothetical protein
MFYQDLVVAIIQINLSEVFAPRELIKEVIDSGFDNQCRVTRFHLFSVTTRLGSHKMMRWDGCAPCFAVLGSVA